MANIHRIVTPSLIVFTGRDRNKVLNNLTTQDFRTLSSGQASETFITDPKGKAIGHGIAFSLGEKVYVVTVPDQSTKLVSHFDRFIIMEDAIVRDATSEFQFWIIRDAASFAKSPEWESIVPMGECQPNGVTSTTLADLKLFNAQSLAKKPGEAALPNIPRGAVAYPTQVPLNSESDHPTDPWMMFVSAPWIGPDSIILMTASAANLPELPAWLENAPVWDLNNRADLEVNRLQADWPWFGLDFDEKNLPQEIDRDDTGISFNKGCYLGQETIARLDALGQVQKKLVRLKIDSIVDMNLQDPESQRIWADDKEIGMVRSWATLPNDQIMAFGFVKRSHFASGTRVGIGPDQDPAVVLSRTNPST